MTHQQTREHRRMCVRGHEGREGGGGGGSSGGKPSLVLAGSLAQLVCNAILGWRRYWRPFIAILKESNVRMLTVERSGLDVVKPPVCCECLM